MASRKDLTEVSEELVAELRILGNKFGPMGVATVAAELTDIKVLIHILSEEAAKPGTSRPEEVSPPAPSTLASDLEGLLNMHSAENASNTPDFILAEYLMDCLHAFETASRHREQWYGKRLSIAGVVTDLTASEGLS
jgi:hypothetical protein